MADESADQPRQLTAVLDFQSPPPITFILTNQTVSLMTVPDI